MSRDDSLRTRRLIQALNEDIERELEAADECLARAISAGWRQTTVRRLSVISAAAALRRATALAAEVMNLGGIPRSGGRVLARRLTRQEKPGRALTSTVDACRHYQRRLWMANQLGLLRLGEVFREIIRDLQVHSADAFGLAPPSPDEPIAWFGMSRTYSGQRE